MSEIILRHLDALAAQMKLGLAQIEAARHALSAPTTPKVRVELPLRCAGVDPSACALRDGDWDTSRATFGDPSHAICHGCGCVASAGEAPR